jgi:hypothetical protein
MTDTGWIVEGAEVAKVTSHGVRATVMVVTIERITATQVVLSSGERYRRDTLRPVGKTDRGPYRELLPITHPKVINARVVGIAQAAKRNIDDLSVPGAALNREDALEYLLKVQEIAGVAMDKISRLTP